METGVGGISFDNITWPLRAIVRVDDMSKSFLHSVGFYEVLQECPDYKSIRHFLKDVQDEVERRSRLNAVYCYLIHGDDQVPAVIQITFSQIKTRVDFEEPSESYDIPFLWKTIILFNNLCEKKETFPLTARGWGNRKACMKSLQCSLGCLDCQCIIPRGSILEYCQTSIVYELLRRLAIKRKFLGSSFAVTSVHAGSNNIVAILLIQEKSAEMRADDIRIEEERREDIRIEEEEKRRWLLEDAAFADMVLPVGDSTDLDKENISDDMSSLTDTAY